MGCKAVQYVPEIDEGGTPSMVDAEQREVKSQLLPSRRWQRSWLIPSAKRGFTRKYEAAHKRTRRRIAALATAERLGLLARISGVLLRHRRSSKPARYYRDTIGAP